MSRGQEDEQLPFYLPLWAFSVENTASLREPTSIDTSGKLLLQFASDGFVTTGNPIMIRMEEGAVNLFFLPFNPARACFPLQYSSSMLYPCIGPGTAY